MRELKFRAWDKENEVYLNPDETFLIAGNGYYPATFSSTFGYTANENLVIEQYTGLKDKNGKEIYEGDIVASLTKSIKGVKPSFYSYLKGVVKYCEEDTRYYIDGSCERSDREILEKVDLTDVDNFVGNYYELEVIGNIHENPELLGGKE